MQALPNIYLNKMLPAVDYGAVACWLRHLNEREALGIVTINETSYSELPHVSMPSVAFSLSTFFLMPWFTPILRD